MPQPRSRQLATACQPAPLSKAPWELSATCLPDAGPVLAHAPHPAFLNLPVAIYGLVAPSWPQARLAAMTTSAVAISWLLTGLQSQLSNKDIQAGVGPAQPTARVPQNWIRVCHDAWFSSFLPAANQKHLNTL